MEWSFRKSLQSKTPEINLQNNDTKTESFWLLIGTRQSNTVRTDKTGRP
jgi:hypothetical protein